MSFQLKTSSRDHDLQEGIHLLKILSSLDTSSASSSEFSAAAQKIITSQLDDLGFNIQEHFSKIHCEQALQVIKTSSLNTRPYALAKFCHEWIHERHTQGVLNESTASQFTSLEL